MAAFVVRIRRPRAAWVAWIAVGLCCFGLSACAHNRATPPDPGGTPPHEPASVAERPVAEPAGPRILLRFGQQPAGPDDGFVGRLGLAVTNGRGELGFTGTIQHRDRVEPFVWLGDGIVWRGDSSPETSFSPPSPLLGIGNDSQFLFSGLIDGRDGLWSHRGLLLHKGDWAAGLDEGAVINYSRRPTMTADGTGYWISEFKDGKGTGRALLKSPGTTPEATTVVLRSDDLVDGKPIARPRGVDLSYQVSDNGEHLIQVLQLGDSMSTDDVVYLDGSVVLRRGEPTRDLDRWTRFTVVAVNDDGDYLVGGETDGKASNRVLAYNGSVAVREGQTLDGRTLAAEAALMSASLDNQGRAVHLWSTAGFGAIHLFFACDAARLEESVHVLSTGTELPLGDGYPPIEIDNFNFAGHGPVLSLGPGREVFVEAMLKAKTAEGTVALDGVLGLPLPACDAQSPEPSAR